MIYFTFPHLLHLFLLCLFLNLHPACCLLLAACSCSCCCCCLLLLVILSVLITLAAQVGCQGSSRASSSRMCRSIHSEGNVSPLLLLCTGTLPSFPPFHPIYQTANSPPPPPPPSGPYSFLSSLPFLALLLSIPSPFILTCSLLLVSCSCSSAPHLTCCSSRPCGS